MDIFGLGSLFGSATLGPVLALYASGCGPPKMPLRRRHIRHVLPLKNPLTLCSDLWAACDQVVSSSGIRHIQLLLLWVVCLHSWGPLESNEQWIGDLSDPARTSWTKVMEKDGSHKAKLFWPLCSVYEGPGQNSVALHYGHSNGCYRRDDQITQSRTVIVVWRFWWCHM